MKKFDEDGCFETKEWLSRTYAEKPAWYHFFDRKTGESLYIGSTRNLRNRMCAHKEYTKNPDNKWAHNKPLYEYLHNTDNDGVVLFFTYVKEENIKYFERKYIEEWKPRFNRDRVQSTSPLDLTSEKENYNEYHRLYLQKNREYNAEHAEYCRNYYQTHKDYFKRKYAEYRARKEGK